MARRACGGLRAKHGNEPLSAMSNYLGDFPRRKSGKWRACERLKKIEQEPSGECQKSEYLTLLNTFENATTRYRRGPGEPYLG